MSTPSPISLETHFPVVAVKNPPSCKNPFTYWGLRVVTGKMRSILDLQYIGIPVVRRNFHRCFEGVRFNLNIKLAFDSEKEAEIFANSLGKKLIVVMFDRNADF